MVLCLIKAKGVKTTATGSLLLAASLLAAQNAGADVTKGLTGYWNFDDNLTDQAELYAFAASESPDDAIFSSETDSVFGTGLFGKSYEGNGGSGHAAIALTDELSGVVTGNSSVSFWFKAQGPTSTWQGAVAVGEGSAWRVARASADNPLRMAYAGGSTDIYSTTTFGSPEAPVAEWHHIAAVTEGGVSTRLYVDGVLQATGGAPTLTTNGSAELWIGGNPQAGGRAWNGNLDDVAVWNRPLTQEDITKIFSEGKNNAKSLGDILTQEAADTDSDGLPDSWEIANLPAGAHQDNGSANPAFGPNGDPDADGSANLQEFQRGTKPQVADTDEDGLKDGVETGTGTFASVSDTGTDPLRADTDGDGLKDGVENPLLLWNPANAEEQPGTSPLLADSDDDTFPDGIEVTYGSNPTSPTSIPGAVTLPIVDNFEDGIFDPARWAVNLEVATGGASVIEQSGHMTLIGRGHFYTKDQFDPAAVGGIYITGKWTFRSADDFIQILTRTDAIPEGQYGETQTGIEFYASQTDNGLNISGRGGLFSIDSITKVGAIVLNQGSTYDFTIIDNGQEVDNGPGYLSFRISEVGNPGNSGVVSANLATSAAAANHIAFHNRESGRTSELEEVTIGTAKDTDTDGMPDLWEIGNGLNSTAADGGADADSDGVTNVDEYKRGLNPKNADTDGDGLADGKETGTREWVSADDTGTDPLLPDTDSDGLKDGVETNTGVFLSATNTGSNPNVPDTDGDGLNDGPEVTIGRNPVNPADGRSGLDVGLVAYWNFDGTLEDIAHSANLGESTVADNGTFTGAPDVSYSEGPGHFGSNSLFLTGGSGWVTVPKSLDTIGDALTKNVSISIWLKANSFDSEWQAAISHGEGSHWRIARQGNTFPGNMAYAGGSGDIYSSTTFEPATEWYHVAAVTTEGVGTALFINGVQESTGAEPNLDVNLALSPNLYIGANPQAGGREWNGEIDDAAIWNRALSAEEVAEIYAADGGGSSLGALLGYGGAAPALRISAYSYNAATKQVSLTWNTVEGTNYAINHSVNLTDWTGVAVENVPAAGGGATSTTSTFTVPAAVTNAGKLFFRVKSK